MLVSALALAVQPQFVKKGNRHAWLRDRVAEMQFDPSVGPRVFSSLVRLVVVGGCVLYKDAFLKKGGGRTVPKY